MMWTDTAFRDRMLRGWHGGRGEGTECGRGSKLENTATVRMRLPNLVQEYDIRRVCDAGAGDLHWIQAVQWDVEYQAFDLVPRHPSVRELDITREVLPACDLILCRLVLGHMDPPRVLKALDLFRKSGARYLLATNHAGTNSTERLFEHNHWNLCIEPFCLGDPIESIPDTRDYLLSLWRLA